MKSTLLPLLPVVLFAACSAAPPAGVADPGAPMSCDALAASASREVVGTIASHAACSADADCVLVAFSASCFDRCARAMNASGGEELRAVKDRVDAAQCRRFEERGCKSFAPPCMAPAPPRCRAGACV